ncbi:hypothetical protein KUTeg_024258 [Tegillarca granosa]|uniref:Alpha-galactosidase n=1 Tax=Tegillarca granosa TaxID=220873 RepID=A0ABQ9DXI6_TEGGR|nr:hypothetical protein KUTeg_024258 [Tegillarca granosa]
MGNRLFLCIVVASSLAFFSGILSVVKALDNGLARTPPMGWMHWERFRCITNCTEDPENCLSEKLIMETADRMAADGYRDAGYKYISIDDCWMSKQRDSSGRLQSDPIRFPSGIKALADYVHSKGLKLGIYEDFGQYTCMGYPGSEFYLELDANTFAEWGVDMLKLDGCNSNIHDMTAGYETMGFFLNRTNRPILYACSWPAYTDSTANLTDYNVIKKHCNMWRNYRDIQDSWEITLDIINYYGKDDGGFSQLAGPGAWNDPDEVTNLRKMRASSKELLLNKRLLAINQDPLGIQGVRLWQTGSVGAWMRPLAGNKTYAIALLNSDNQGVPTTVNVKLENFGLTQESSYTFYDAFDGSSFGTFSVNDTIKVRINPTRKIKFNKFIN